MARSQAIGTFMLSLLEYKTTITKTETNQSTPSSWPTDHQKAVRIFNLVQKSSLSLTKKMKATNSMTTLKIARLQTNTC